MHTSSTKPISTARFDDHRLMTLQKGALVSVENPRSQTVECIRGLIWITHDNEPEDIILSPGQMHFPQSNARMIVQGLSNSEMRIHRQRERSLASFRGHFRSWRFMLPGIAATPPVAGPRGA